MTFGLWACRGRYGLFRSVYVCSWNLLLKQIF